MIHGVGRFEGAQRTIEGDYCIILSVDDDDIVDRLMELSDEKLSFDIDKYHDKRSLNANRYLWKLCDLIARKIGSDKDTVYIMKLMEYGVNDLYEIPKAAVDQWIQLWRYTKVEYEFTATVGLEGIDMVGIRCWKGTHLYDSREMAEMLNGIKQDANDLGIDTWSDDEIAHALSVWTPRKEE